MLTEAILIGMPPYDFWYNDPKLFFNYVEAYTRKQKRKYEMDRYQMNFTAWLHGLYIDYALKVNPSMGKSRSYLKEPIDINNDNDIEEKKKIMSEEEKREFEEKLAIAQFEQFGRYTKLYNKEYYGEEDGE